MRAHAVRQLAAVLGAATTIVVLTPALAAAHPLGNFTVNQYAGLRVSSARVDVDYIVDMAEIPTFQAHDQIDRNRDGAIDDREAAAYARSRCRAFASGLHVAVDGARVAVHPASSASTLPIGQAGLPTLRMQCAFQGPIADAGEHRLTFADTNLGDRVGWHEVTAIGDGVTLHNSTVPTKSISDRLARYPSDRLQSPLDVRTARLGFRPGGASAPAASTVHTTTGSVVRGFDELTQSFTSSVAARDLTLGVALAALAIGVALGAIHAFAPGHGKTVMAAYLVGERGTVRDGLLIGVTVAVTHTLGVLVLGSVLTASQELAPESVYPYLSAASGLCFVTLGATLLVRAVQRRRAGVGLLDHSHHHAHHGQDHSHHHGDEHSHHHRDHDHPSPPSLSRRNLVTLGFAGGLVPTPTAVVVILGATAIGRAWFGALLVVAYGIGMAATLVLAGLLLAHARRRFDLRARSARVLRVATLVPIITALVVTAVGFLLVVRAGTSV
jgi:ABC-type nickel/cobalt efflux system permease component RcnA